MSQKKFYSVAFIFIDFNFLVIFVLQQTNPNWDENFRASSFS